MEEHLLTRLNRDRASTDPISDPAVDDDNDNDNGLRPSLRARRKPLLNRRRLFVCSLILIVLSISTGFAYAVFWMARYFWRMAFDPHREAASRYQFRGPPVVESYYGEHVPQFDVVASVFVRIGKEFSDENSRVPSESASLGDWQSLYSQKVFSRISPNSTVKRFDKTVDVAIPSDILSQFYKPDTFFPEIVNTFVIVPSDPDPLSTGLEPLRVETADWTQRTASSPSPDLTSWTKSSLSRLARPVDPSSSDPEDRSQAANASWSLNTFYDSGAVREFALSSVKESRVSWDLPRGTMRPPVRTNETISVQSKSHSQILHGQRLWLAARRNATLKIKTRSWVSMAKEMPKYNIRLYNQKRRNMFDNQPWYKGDPLNNGMVFLDVPFNIIGHYQSLIIPESDTINGSREMRYYGPYLTLREHATGTEDWIILPRLNESHSLQPDPFIIPWHVTFDLLSNLGIVAADALNKDKYRWIKPNRGPFFGNTAYTEAKTLQAMDFINAVLGNSHTSSKRPILRSVFFFVGGFIQYFLGFILQTYYMFSRSSSTGLSLPPTMIYLSVSIFCETFDLFLRFGRPRSAVRMSIAILAINVVSLWQWACIWWSIGFTWIDRNGSISLKVQRFKPSHLERTSRRADQKFTWIQRGLFVVLLTIVLKHLPKLPDLISPTHIQDPDFRLPRIYIMHAGLLHTIRTWLRKLHLNEYGGSLMTSLSTMAALAQVLLNWRLGTFAGSFPAFAWAQVVGTVLSWTPTVFESLFGKFHATDPLSMGVAARFVLDLVVLWQAVTLPTVKQEEDEDE